MELDKIERLLEKYFEAETSIAEETELKRYFASEDVAQHLQQYRPLFGYALGAKQDKPARNITLHIAKPKRTAWLSVAAAAILLGAGWFTFQNYSQPKAQDLGVVNDPEVAFRETQKALAMISESVNKGIGSMNYLNEFEQSKNKIFKK